MKVIHKYPIDIVEIQDIFIPKGARILCVKLQQYYPMLWALVEVDPINPMNKEPEPRKILTVGTGHIFDDTGWNYIGTYVSHGGLHVFEGQ